MVGGWLAGLSGRSRSRHRLEGAAGRGGELALLCGLLPVGRGRGCNSDRSVSRFRGVGAGRGSVGRLSTAGFGRFRSIGVGRGDFDQQVLAYGVQPLAGKEPLHGVVLLQFARREHQNTLGHLARKHLVGRHRPDRSPQVGIHRLGTAHLPAVIGRRAVRPGQFDGLAAHGAVAQQGVEPRQGHAADEEGCQKPRGQRIDGVPERLLPPQKCQRRDASGGEQRRGGQAPAVAQEGEVGVLPQHDGSRKRRAPDEGRKGYGRLHPPCRGHPLRQRCGQVDEEGEGRREVDGQLRAEERQHDQRRDDDGEEEALEVGHPHAAHQRREDDARDEQRPRGQRVPVRHEVVPEGLLVVEGVDGAVDCLVEEQVIEVLRPALEPDGQEPEGAAAGDDAPRVPSAAAGDEPRLALDEQEERRREQRDEQPDRPLGEERQPGEEREERAVEPLAARAGVELPEGVERQRDEHAHEHVHPHADRQPEEEPAGHQHQGGRHAVAPFDDGAQPALHGGEDDHRRQQRQQREVEHLVLSEEEPAQHDEPQVEGRFVGVGLALEGEGEEVPLAQRLVGDAQVAQFVRGGEVPEEHHRKQGQQAAGQQQRESMLHGRVCVR